jgi:hypothetical protein
MGYTFLVDTLSAVGFNLCLSSRRRDLNGGGVEVLASLGLEGEWLR